MDLQVVFELLAGFVGWPALLAAAINIAKHFGLPDGTAPKVNFIANLVAFVGVGVAVYFGKVDLLPGIDVALGNVANILLAVLALLTNPVMTKIWHVALKGLPVVGKSYSAAQG